MKHGFFWPSLHTRAIAWKITNFNFQPCNDITSIVIRFPSFFPVLLEVASYCIYCLATCSSLAGFQSGSNMTRRLAPIKFSPHPPALLDNLEEQMRHWSRTLSRAFTLSVSLSALSSHEYELGRSWIIKLVDDFASRFDAHGAVKPDV